MVCFQYKHEAIAFYERLKHRMAHFGLSLAEEKCRLIEFGRFAASNRRNRGEGKPETFDFLGFTHFCSHYGNGKFRVRRKTSRKKFIKKCKDVFKRIGEMRTMKTKCIIAKLNEILVGYYHYYGVNGNYPAVIAFRWHVLKSLHYWLNKPFEERHAVMQSWLDRMTPTRNAVECILEIMRSTIDVRRCEARSGSCSLPAQGAQNWSIVQVAVPSDSRQIPEVSVNKFMLWIHFLEAGESMRTTPSRADFAFDLGVCGI